MTEPLYDVVAVGNAIVDILSMVDEKELTGKRLVKGTMTLIDRETSDALINTAGPIKQRSGGSAGNTIAGLASFGSRCGFIGKVADDLLGQAFKHDLRSQGIDAHFNMDNPSQTPTACCMIFVTPDADRTMATYLGISTEIAPDDLSPTLIRNAKVTYLEGYLFDKELAKESFNAAAIMAHTSGNLVALTLSDPFCVKRHREDFLNLVDGHIDILFANEQELLNLYEVTDIEDALTRIAASVETCAITRGAQGAVILMNGQRFNIPAQPVTQIVDTTGAGDLFAAGFLHGFTKELTPEECGLLGAKAAASIISHMGARPEIDLSTLLAA